MSAAIQVPHLSKRFGDVAAVNDVSFEIARGELVGLLGPNGAGKTPDCTRRPRAAQHLVGIVPDGSNPYEELSGIDNLCFCAALYGMRKRERRARASELLKAFGLTDAARRKFETYSKGMKRKLTLAAGIVHRPPILFLDEPTTGIDVAAARGIRQLVKVESAPGEELRIESPAPIRVGPLVRFLEDRGAQVLEARRLHPSLEDVFVRITGIQAREMREATT